MLGHSIIIFKVEMSAFSRAAPESCTCNGAMIFIFLFFLNSFNVFAYLGKVSSDELPLQTPEVIRGDNEIDLQTYHNVQHILISFKLYFGRRLFFS